MYLQRHTLRSFRLQEMQGGEIKCLTFSQSECICVLPCKYLHTFLFPPHASHGMLSFSTCCLIPLLTAGRQVNWYPPPCLRQGSTLMELRLGLCFGWQHTRGNDILSSPGAAASGCINLLLAAYSCWPSPVNSAQPSRYVATQIHSVQIQTHVGTHTHKCVALVNAHACAHTKKIEVTWADSLG